jgi:hypothetical protein
MLDPMNTSRIAMLLCAVSCMIFAAPVRADTSGTWMGTVTYINKSRIGVKSQSQTKDFILPAGLGEVYSGDTKISIGEIKVGDLVRIGYSASTLFGSTRATRIDLLNFRPLPAPTTQATGPPDR